jgi:hypothetical protein
MVSNLVELMSHPVPDNGEYRWVPGSKMRALGMENIAKKNIEMLQNPPISAFFL